MIASGEKKEEYREIKAYWNRRLNQNLWSDNFKPVPFTHVLFTNGYSEYCPKMLVEIRSIQIGKPKDKWTDGWHERDAFVISLGEICDFSKSMTQQANEAQK